MKRIKDLRTSIGYTQKALAELLQTTQQTIARWETGAVEPSLKSLRDLAMIFGVSVDDLLGTNPLNEDPQAAARYLLDVDSKDAYWGNFGVLLPGHEKTKWFPITGDSYRRLRSCLSAHRSDDEWVTVQTLNNRMLVLRPNMVKRLWLVNEVCGPVDDDWEVAWDEIGGAPLELYRQLHAHFLESDDTDEEISEAFKAAVEDAIRKQGLTDENIEEFLHHAHIHFIDGSSTSYWPEASHLWQIFCNAEAGAPELTFELAAIGYDFESFFPVDQLSLINMSLIDLIDAVKKV